MKILKTVLIIVLIGILIYIVIAIFTPPINQANTVYINKSRDQIFDKFSDQNDMIKWLPGLKTITQLSGTPNTIGSVAEFVFETGGYEIPVLVTINDYIENEKMDLTITHEKLEMDLAINLIPQNDATKLDICYEIKSNTLMTKAAMPLISPLIKEHSALDLDKIKNLLDNTN